MLSLQQMASIFNHKSNLYSINNLEGDFVVPKALYFTACRLLTVTELQLVC